LILVAGGVADDYATVSNFSNDAARARLTIYAVRPVDGLTYAGDAREGMVSQAGVDGLHMLVGDTGGAAFDAVGSAAGVWSRIGRETAGSYVLGVEAPAGLADRSAKVSVRVKRRGVIVRSPTQVFRPATPKAVRDGKAAIEGLLGQPRTKTDLSLRTATYTVRGASGSDLKTIVLTEVGQGSDLDGLLWGYEVRDGEKIVAKATDRRAGESRGAAGELLTEALALAPGSYTLRLGVVMRDGRAGSVERPFEVGLQGAASHTELQASDLFVGRAVGGRFVPALTIPRADGSVAASLELYGQAGATLTNVNGFFAIEDDNGTIHAKSRGQLGEAGDRKWKAQSVLEWPTLETGRYTIVAALVVSQKPVLTLRHSIIVS
jgi:hypothetical protein